MPIVIGTQEGLNATFWGINPYFNRLMKILSRRGVNVEPIQTEADKSVISIGTPSIVVFWGKQINEGNIKEIDFRDLRVSYEFNRKLAKSRVKPAVPAKFDKVPQVSNFAASYLRACGYKVNVSIENPEQLPDLDLGLNSGIRFDLVDPSKIDPAILKAELGLDC